MKCPYCGNVCEDGALYCDVCRKELPTAQDNINQPKKKKAPKTALQKLTIVLAVLASFAIVGVGLYKLVYWIDSYKITRLYKRGAYTPAQNETEMDDGRMGHALVFYGEDGDKVYLPELNRSLAICGGVARLEIADSDWFGDNVSEYDSAEISFTPVLIKENGKEIQLPNVDYTVNVPESPIEVLSPEDNDTRVVTSVYPVDLQVVPGSSVFINGEDLTDQVDRGGALSVKVAVQPIGDNTYSVIVRTPRHKETRKDIVIYRQAYDIEIELDSEVSTRSSSKTMIIKGKCEPGASISVDTSHIEESVQFDMTTGEFSFIVEFSNLYNNIVRFRAQKEGRQDAVISFTVNYVPSLAVYSAAAWKMDYQQLRTLFEQWTGQVFLCEGPVVDVFTSDDTQYIVMDVGPEGEEQLVILENLSRNTPSIGPRYTAYADVNDRYMYNSKYYPKLNCPYIDLTPSK